MKRILYIILLALLSQYVNAQQHPMVSQYQFNAFLLNPAYAGSQRPLSTSIHHRRQWLGFEGAPVTSFLAVDGMLKNNKNALGFILSHDKIGVVTEAGFSLNYAYHVRISRTHRLSLGISGGLGHYAANFKDIVVWDPNDPVYVYGIESKLYPKAGFGAYYYTPDFFAGASIPTLLAYGPDGTFDIDISRHTLYHRHYFFNTGFIRKLKEDIFIRPTVLIKYLPQAPVQADISCSLLLMDAFATGLTYRTGESVAILGEYQFQNGLRIGYSYDLNINKISTFSTGSHEIVIGWDLIREGRFLRPF